MNRTELFQITKKHNWALAKIRQELIDYYRSEKGQEELANARISVEFNDDFPLSAQPVERVIDLLMMEVEAYARNFKATSGES